MIFVGKCWYFIELRRIFLFRLGNCCYWLLSMIEVIYSVGVGKIVFYICDCLFI